MKYVLIVPDGMADHPLPALDGRTPMMAAPTPHLDALARDGLIGRVRTIPPGMPPGSDVAALSIMGYDPATDYTGRAPLEAASMGVELAATDVAFRCNLITTDGERIVDYSGGEVTSEEGAALIALVAEKLGTPSLRFYPGVSYRNLLVWQHGSVDVRTTPPHDVMGQPIAAHLPDGDGDTRLRGLIWDAYALLNDHPINRRRRDAGKNPANMLWPWGQGYAPRLRAFALAHGVMGTVISAVDLIRGIARLAGLRAPLVPGATGRLDTNWRGKADAARRALEASDFVMVHVEAPDECGHHGDLDGKLRAIALTDREIIGPVWEAARAGGPARILVLPDHFTPLAVRTHVGDPVPFVLCGAGVRPDRADRLDEAIARESPVMIEEGHTLIARLMA
ncbi:MAG TPA: cofactor-independent phosphoglycerate mutase [Armatimonadota bacterium]|nr:cofactor-independent phosphoglycerate mutase [Armatimonadota bacterium]